MLELATFPVVPKLAMKMRWEGGCLIPPVLNAPTRPVELSTLNSLSYQKKELKLESWRAGTPAHRVHLRTLDLTFQTRGSHWRF